MDGLKIVALCVAASVAYGILHDMVTAHLCVEYFADFHPDIFGTRSPVLLAVGWGVLATWWMGAIFGGLLAGAAQTGEMPKMTWRDLLPRVVIVLAFSYAGALAAGLFGYFGQYRPPFAVGDPRMFTAVWFAHNAFYLASAAGAMALVAWTIRRRTLLARGSAKL